MKVIDAKGTFTLTHLKEFMDVHNIQDSIIISANEDILTTKVEFFEDFWKLVNVPDDIEITIASDLAMLTFTGADFNWWNKTQKRRDKLMTYESVEIKEKKATKAVTVQDDTMYNVAVATKDSHFRIIDIATNFGPHDESVRFINEQIRQRKLMSFYRDEVVICLDYHDDENDVWKTIDELVENGNIKLK